MEYPGLLNWANSVRLTMASDPGRQLFKDQVQTHGFLFLDDYLDSIISGQKQDPLIELVKTPGRKKAASRKPKLITSKLGNPIPLSFEDSNENENILSKDLVKSLPKVDGATKMTTAKLESPQEPPESLQRPPILPLQPSNKLNDVSLGVSEQSMVALHVSVLQLTTELIPPSNSEYNDLSVIAEDDEPSERNVHSTSKCQDEPPKSPLVVPQVVEKSDMSLSQPSLQHDNDMPPGDRLASMSSMDTFHSVPLNSPGERIQQTQTFPHITEVSPIEDHSELPEAQTLQSLNDKDHVMADIREEVLETTQKLVDKPNVAASFPTLPEPVPLRKSMKALRDPSTNVVLLGAATPGAPVGGKRTSWLMKAREAKALEGLSKKPHPPGMGSGVGSSSSLAPQGTKRKSDPFSLPQVGIRDDERPPKIARTMEGGTVSYDSRDHSLGTPGLVNMAPTSSAEGQSLPPVMVESPQEGVFDRLKKTVEVLGVRVSKTMGKGVGSDTATVLAEARAAAKAKVAERDRKEELTMALAAPEIVEQKTVSRQENEKRLSISDLFPAEGRVKEKHKVPEKPFQFMPNISAAVHATTTRISTSTTPPHSPPRQSHSFTIPTGPVFNKPPPVFVPPIQVVTKPIASTRIVPDTILKSNAQSTTALGFSPRRPSPLPTAKNIVPLTAHSTLESIQSDSVFDRDDIPAWMPSTQDTEYTAYVSQSQPQDNQILDEDDSWPMDEKLAAGVQWAFGVSKEDSMTWSTLPSQSQRADTGPVTKTSSIKEEVAVKELHQRTQQIPGTSDVDMEDDRDADPHHNLETQDVELEELIISAPKFVPAESMMARSQSQMSMASSDSQSQGGFLGHASKLLSSALGTSKKGKQPEVKKVLQMAAVAAKKQQEEADKKVARLKEMESRRQLAIQRKTEEERAKALEEERKMKEEVERRKREREELTDKKPIKSAGIKKEDENLKKRKLEVEKKQEIKKSSSNVLMGKAHLKSALKPSSATNSSYLYGSLSQPVASTSTVPAEASYKDKTLLAQNVDDEVSQPSMLVQSQMAARVKVQIDAAKRAEPAIPSEKIELPDINSEYSDSEDEDRVRTFDPPEWAQSPELRQALEMQSTINPDDIFGAVRPLKMEEMFKTRTSRFRARTSSANWAGTDRLTAQEEKEYARRMGFK